MAAATAGGSGRVTTHVLDLANGRPAAGVLVHWWRIDAAGDRIPLGVQATNADGRVEPWPLMGAAADPGTFELVFGVGRYYAALGAAMPDPPFLDQVPIRFGVADPSRHYHVPLLVSPWGYSTYRGS